MASIVIEANGAHLSNANGYVMVETRYVAYVQVNHHHNRKVVVTKDVSEDPNVGILLDYDEDNNLCGVEIVNYGDVIK